MGLGLWLRSALLPLLVLGLQGAAAWWFVRVADAAWGPGGSVDPLAAEQTTRLLFTGGGPLALLLLAWGLFAVWSRLRLPAALATTVLYVPGLLVGGLATWVLGVFLGWI